MLSFNEELLKRLSIRGKNMFKINELEKITKGKLIQKGVLEGVSDISIDSRNINSGECFLALKGAHYDGFDFIKEAVSKKVSLIISSSDIAVDKSVSLIKVKDPIAALGDIAAVWRSKFDIPCIAITGSNGKSTTKQMIASAISSLGSILKTEGNYNNLIGLPLTVLRWNKAHKAAVLEMGMNASGEIARLTHIANPHVGLITNVSPAHLELLDNIENVAKAKGELFENMTSNGTVVVNLEDPWVVKLAKKYKGKLITFGMQNSANVRFGRLESKGLESIDMTIYVESKEYKIHLKVPGAHNVMNAMAAIAVSLSVGVSVDDAIKGVENFEPMSMRMERVQLAKGIQLINDCYNANPLSMREALRTVSGAKRAGRLVAIVGDMLELGKNTKRCHHEVGVIAAKYKVDKLFAFGDHAADIATGAAESGLNSGKVGTYRDMEELKKDVLGYVKTGDIILVKGSRGMKMERVVDHLKDIIGVE